MINGISIIGKYMTAHGGNASTYINGHSGAQGVGNMRFNTSTQRIEVYDGNNWAMINMSTASVGLNSEAESLLDWARKKRDEEIEIYALATTNEAVRIALEQLEQAKTRLELTAILARDHETTTS